MSFYGDSLLSSPDPLGMPNDLSTPSPRKARRSTASPSRIGTSLADATPNKHVQEIYISTPPARRNGSATKSTSPWRVRLTVETERVDDERASPAVKKSPAKHLTEHIMTTMVPLKGGNDTPPAAVKRGRGRPRKSLDTPIKKSGTPIPKGAGRRKTVPGIMQEDDMLDAWAPTPPKKATGRPRKSVKQNVETPHFERASTPLRMPIADVVEDNVITDKSSRTRSRRRRQEITPMKRPMKRPMGSDTDDNDRYTTMQESTRLDTQFQLFNDHKSGRMKPTATHILTPRMPKGYVPHSSPESSPIQRQDEKTLKSNNNGPMDPSFEVQQDQAGLDPTNEHEEYDTILESEGFSMISSSSLASTGNHNAGFSEQNKDAAPLDTAIPKLSPQSNSLSLVESAPKSERVLEPVASDDTASVAPSPLLPRPLKEALHRWPRALEQATDGTPEPVRVVRTGAAFQDVVSPQSRTENWSSLSHQSGKSDAPISASSPASRPVSFEHRKDHPFSGFGAGTRRELRAGLRLGEELAKRQQQSHQGTPSTLQAVNDGFSEDTNAEHRKSTSSNEKADSRPEVNGPSNDVQYPSFNTNQLPSPEGTVVDIDDDQMSWKADTPVKLTPVKSYDATSEASRSVQKQNEGGDSIDDSDEPPEDNNMTTREAEWQREREAVSRQIEMANKSQVIVVNSDSEDEEDKQEQGLDGMVENPTMQSEETEESDIWQAEASMDRSEKSVHEASEILQQPEAARPRRSKLPSPWRRGSQVIYSDEFEPTETSTKTELSWQPAQEKLSKLRDEINLQSQNRADDSTGALLDRQLNLPERSGAMAMSPPKVPASRMKQVPVSTKTTLEAKQCVKRTHLSKLPTTSDQTLGEHSGEVAGDMIMTPPAKKEAFNVVPNAQEGFTAAIDPQLFRRPTCPSTEMTAPNSKPKAIQSSSTSSSSWLSRLTTPVIKFFTLATPLPPPANKSDILCSGPYEPLCQLTPWHNTHTRALEPLYYASFLYGSHIFPYNPNSRSAVYLGLTVATQPLGWTRKITKMDCGVTDAFMVLLEERGYALGEPGEEWIDESLVVRMCVTIWETMVMRGEVDVNRWIGEAVGYRAQCDRLWTKADIDWTNNSSAYFERKRKEFEGLPSWLEMGIEWDPETQTAKYPDAKVV